MTEVDIETPPDVNLELFATPLDMNPVNLGMCEFPHLMPKFMDPEFYQDVVNAGIQIVEREVEIVTSPHMIRIGLVAEGPDSIGKKSSRKSSHIVKEDVFETVFDGMVNVDATPTTKEDMITIGLIAERGDGMTCLLCGWESGWRGFTRIQRHMESKHSIGPGYPCPKCDYVAKTKDDCQKHGRLSHRVTFSYSGAADNKPNKVRKLK